MGLVGAFWGIAGVVCLLGSAVWRLSVVASEALASPLDWYHWAVLVAFTLFMAFSEGYRGFQQGFSPRVAARARYLRENPRPHFVLLAPLFCMGYFHATRKRQLISLIVTAAIVGVVLLVKLMPQPWRGIIDVGVVVGLGWGIVSILVFTATTFAADAPFHDPEVPAAG